MDSGVPGLSYDFEFKNDYWPHVELFVYWQEEVELRNSTQLLARDDYVHFT